MGRHIAKNIVSAGLAKKCEIQIAYAIGVAEPVSVMVDLMGTGTIPKAKVEELVTEVFDLRPAAIIEYLDLLRGELKSFRRSFKKWRSGLFD